MDCFGRAIGTGRSAGNCEGGNPGAPFKFLHQCETDTDKTEILCAKIAVHMKSAIDYENINTISGENANDNASPLSVKGLTGIENLN
jgi:hypothetical protein